jgi:hypothetical protein
VFSSKQIVKAYSLPLFELTGVLVRLNHVASFIVNANHSVMGTAEKLARGLSRGSTLDESQIVRRDLSDRRFPVRRRMYD